MKTTIVKNTAEFLRSYLSMAEQSVEFCEEHGEAVETLAQETLKEAMPLVKSFILEAAPLILKAKAGMKDIGEAATKSPKLEEFEAKQKDFVEKGDKVANGFKTLSLEFVKLWNETQVSKEC